MGLIIVSQKQIDEYFASEALNQSTLKSLQGGFGVFMADAAKKRKEKEENKPTPEHFLIGSACDTILTGEDGEFEKQYYVSTLDKKPSGVEMSIFDIVFHELEAENMLDTVPWENCDNAILIAANEMKWQTNWKDETRIKKLLLAGETYFEDLKAGIGKEILSSVQNDTIKRICESLRTHFRTKKYFDRSLQAEVEHIDFFYQLPIFFTHEGVECKALMDLVAVHKDPETGKIVKIEPIDLKTMSGSVMTFTTAVRTRRYDIQAAWYTLALSKYFDVQYEIIDKFKFVVESSTSIGSPLVFEITNDTLIHGITGAPEAEFKDVNGIRSLYYPEQKGYMQLFEEYQYYVAQGFRQDKLLDEKSSVITLDYVKGLS
jgi:hypothetical protein